MYLRSVLAMAVCFGSTCPAFADGLLVVGITSDPGKDGFVYAYRVDQKDTATLRESLMEECRNTKIENTENARKACKVVGEFRNKCFAFVFDPKIGTPGVGWAIAASKSEAEQQALEKCKGLSTSERGKYCAVEKSVCDGDAQ